MNINRSRQKSKQRCRRPIAADYSRWKKVSIEMGFFKANIVGGLVGCFTAAIAWVLTIPFMGIVRYQIIGSFLLKKTYKIGLKLTELAQRLNIIETLSYEQALTVRNISYAIFAAGFFMALVVLTILHEFTHKWVWQIGFDKKTKKNGFKIGMKKITPYCHCKVDLQLKKMILGTLAPTLTTGFLIVMIGAFMQDPFVVIAGLFGVAAGGADQTQVLMLLPYLKKAKKKRIICRDLEDAFGCILYIEN